MNESIAETSSPPSPHISWPRWLPFLQAAMIVALVLIIGQPRLDAPWILGDEFIFIVNNPDVTGQASSTPTGWRYLDIFFHTHEDLYQPFTILTYAIQWDLGGEDRIQQIRLFDVLIHALNALLAWRLMAALFARLSPGSPLLQRSVAWSLALLWAVHPMLTSTFAADMGRTHLFAATFCLLSLLCHLKHLDGLRANPPRRATTWGWFIGAFLLLLLAMLNKPVVGWVLIIFILEWILVGLRGMLLSPRIYLVGIACITFALLTLTTTRETFALDQEALPIFGDPVSRALLGLWIYLRNILAPFGHLSPWYPPDIYTGWTHPAVIAGLIFLILGALAAIIAARRKPARGITLGLIWFAATWIPISGVIGARVLAAQDRYMYLPMLGLLVAIGVAFLVWRAAASSSRGPAVSIMALAVVLALATLPEDRRICAEARSTLQRALSAVAQYPDDPRVLEFLAATYDFCRGHAIPEETSLQPEKYLELTLKTLREAAALGERSPEFFPDIHSRAEFHRRISFNLWKLGRFQESLEEALRAYDFEPEARITWTRLAHAYRGLERWQDALAAYQKIYEIMSPDAEDRPLRLLEFADLLLNRFDAPGRALPIYRELLSMNLQDRNLLRHAILGAARCEVLAGQGSDGYELALDVLRAETNNLEAARIIAQYYLRSHKWEEADRAYRAILSQAPTDYEALRGFQNVCLNSGNWADAAFAWQKANELEPENLIFRSHFIWSAACAGEAAAGQWAEELLRTAPDNRFACLTWMLIELRQGRVDAALNWIQRAAAGPELPLAREFIRAEATLEKMVARQELADEAILARAALWGVLGADDKRDEQVHSYLDAHPDSPWRGLAEKILRQEMHPETAPSGD